MYSFTDHVSERYQFLLASCRTTQAPFRWPTTMSRCGLHSWTSTPWLTAGPTQLRWVSFSLKWNNSVGPCEPQLHLSYHPNKFLFACRFLHSLLRTAKLSFEIDLPLCGCPLTPPEAMVDVLLLCELCSSPEEAHIICVVSAILPVYKFGPDRISQQYWTTRSVCMIVLLMFHTRLDWHQSCSKIIVNTQWLMHAVFSLQFAYSN